MVASQTIPYITPEEYLEAERKAEYKSEYYDGQVYAMAGPSPRHGVIVMNLGGELRAALKGRPCQVFTTDLRLQISTRRYAYPDVIVVCGKPKFAEADKNTLLNPQLIIEVLSESTEKYDRGLKFGYYRSLPSLQEYLLVSQDSKVVEHYVRGADGGWTFQATEGLGTRITLASLNIELPLDEIYYNIDFVAE
ncbi:MAG: Uma2 family endonuclease [Bryobacteraceae bacterium]